MVYSLNVFERESVLYPDVDIAFHNILQCLPMALGKCRSEAQGCISTYKAQIDQFVHQEDLARRCEATVDPRVPPRVRWSG